MCHLIKQLMTFHFGGHWFINPFGEYHFLCCSELIIHMNAGITVKCLLSDVWYFTFFNLFFPGAKLPAAVSTHFGIYYLQKTLSCVAFQSFDFARTWWSLVNKRVLYTEFDIYVFITITGSTPLLVILYFFERYVNILDACQ
jgi:hypothetical protein